MDGLTSIKRLFEKLSPFLQGIPRTKNKAGAKYIRNIMDMVLYSLLLSAFTSAVMIMSLYVCKTMWYTYQATHIGQQFLLQYPERAAMISEILDDHLIHLSLELTVTTFITCLCIAAICQFLQLTRYFYTPYGILRRITFFALPLAAAVAWNLQDTYGYTQFKTAYLLGLLPTLCIFSNCFEFTSRLLPEVSDIIAALKAGIQFAKAGLPTIKRHMDAIIQRINEGG